MERPAMLMAPLALLLGLLANEGAVAILAYLVAYALTAGKDVAVFSNFSTRYMMPIYPFVFMILGWFLDSVRKTKFPALSLVLCAVLVAPFMVTVVPRLGKPDIEGLSASRGYGHHLYYKIFRLKYQPEAFEPYLDHIRGLDDAIKPDAYFGLGYFMTKKPRWPIPQLEERFVPYLFYSLGYNGGGRARFLVHLGRNDLLDAVDPDSDLAIYYFLGWGAGLRPGGTYSEPKGASDEVRLLWRTGVKRAEGFAAGLAGHRPPRSNDFDDPNRGEVLLGYGWYLGALSSLDPDDPRTWYLSTTLEWLDILRERSVSGVALRETTPEMSPGERAAIKIGIDQGRAALEGLIQACDLEGTVRILERDRLIRGSSPQPR